MVLGEKTPYLKKGSIKKGRDKSKSMGESSSIDIVGGKN